LNVTAFDLLHALSDSETYNEAGDDEYQQNVDSSDEDFAKFDEPSPKRRRTMATKGKTSTKTSSGTPKSVRPKGKGARSAGKLEYFKNMPQDVFYEVGSVVVLAAPELKHRNVGSRLLAMFFLWTS
jgi:hypothetical protein